MSNLLESLAAELERPRQVTAQVVNHLVGTHGLTRDHLGGFLTDDLPTLEDYEIDLILSPLFTPGLRDQSIFAELLGRDAIAAADWPALVRQLVARPTRARLVTEDGQIHSVSLRDVTVERYVHRLRLDAAIPDSLFAVIAQFAPEDQPLLKAIARRAIWAHASRREILMRHLTTNAEKRALCDDAVELLTLMETYEPADLGELLARIPQWQRVLRQQIDDTAGAKPFFNERVEELHGGGRDQRRQDTHRISAKEAELAFLGRLQQALGGMV